MFYNVEFFNNDEKHEIEKFILKESEAIKSLEKILNLKCQRNWKENKYFNLRNNIIICLQEKKSIQNVIGRNYNSRSRKVKGY